MRLAALLAAVVLAACEPAAPRSPGLVISPTGTYTLDGKPVAAENLAAELQAVAKRGPDTVLYIYVDAESKMFPGLEQAGRAAVAAGLRTSSDVYPEQERRRRIKSWLGDLLFWGAINLVAMLICAPRALSRKLLPAQAFRAGLLGVWVVGVLIAAAIGVVMDIRQHGSGLATIGLTILALANCFAGGLIAGSLFWLWTRIRPKGAPGLP